MADAAIPPGGTEVLDPPWNPWRPADIARRRSGCTQATPWIEALDRALGGQAS